MQYITAVYNMDWNIRSLQDLSQQGSSTMGYIADKSIPFA